MSGGGRVLADPAATEALGRTLAPILRAGDVVTLSGPLGAGKTTFARGVLAGLGHVGETPSPSYALLIAYEPPEVRLPLAHVDLYRLDDPVEIDELGLDDLADEAALLVEWPERAEPSRWPHALRLALTPLATGARCLTWGGAAAWEGRWPPPRS